MNRKTRKSSRTLLEQENRNRRARGLPLLTSLRYPKLDKETVRSASNFPRYHIPREDDTRKMPSSMKPFGADATARRSVMEKVKTGEITGADAEEIIRKSKCLAPAYNKGAVQYIGDEAAARDAGRKV